MAGTNSLKELLATPELAELGPGPRSGVQSEATLRQALDELFGGAKLPKDKKQLVRALLLLWHDHLESAHVIAQSIDNADGAFVHGIMHRREPDYGNAKYWFRRVGKHPSFAKIAQGAGELLEANAQKNLKEKLIPNGIWDSFGFIDACERAAKRGPADPEHQCLREIQRLETESLLAHLWA